MPLSSPHPPASARDKDEPLWFIFNDGKLLIKNDPTGCHVPNAQDLEGIGFSPPQRYAFDAGGTRECFAAQWGNGLPVAGDFAFVPLRSLFGTLDDGIVMAAGLGSQLIHWDRTHRFCGRCGAKTGDKPDERAKVCLQCGLLNYPRISPAIIVAVIKDDCILLARNKRFKRSFYSVLAGFVELGETLEQCVAREVLEETGISVANLRYFGSQPWPFPDSLMVGFLADYAGGDIHIDGLEISDAGWFPRDSLPSIPPRLSIARKLIDWFVALRDA